MHLVYSPKFCITIVSNFSWVLQSWVVPREIEDHTMFMQNFGGVNKVHYCLCENGQQNTSRFSTEMKHLLQFNEMFYWLTQPMAGKQSNTRKKKLLHNFLLFRLRRLVKDSGFVLHHGFQTPRHRWKHSAYSLVLLSCISVFGTCDEALTLVLDILHKRVQLRVLDTFSGIHIRIFSKSSSRQECRKIWNLMEHRN